MRLEITRTADLAVRALCQLRESGRLKSSALAEALGSTPAFMTQVMAPMVRRGWVTSDPGPTGGYELYVQLGELSILQLIEAIEGPTVTGKCVLRGEPCPSEDVCALHDAWLPARAALMERLAATPVSAAAVGT
ncbi:MAG TPA: Rrf2 family transcriptional regulator [Acidimicrobiia bacterium]|nr:Rrf2 family transcriptional regulator [Acidimicrobiia bacterium]